MSELPSPEAIVPRPEVAAMMHRVVSQGYVRNKLTVFPGGRRAASELPVSVGTSAVALAGDMLELPADRHDHDHDRRLDQIIEAKMKGYEGDSCGECGNFTLVRNGTCLKMQHVRLDERVFVTCRRKKSRSLRRSAPSMPGSGARRDP